VHFSVLVALGPCFRVDSKEFLLGKVTVRSIVKYVALLCLLLTVWSAFALVAHHHSNTTESAKCVVCVVAHSAAPKATAHLVKATFTLIASFQAAPVSAKERFVAFALSVRPPPAG
jgi:hypothetical protein